MMFGMHHFRPKRLALASLLLLVVGSGCAQKQAQSGSWKLPWTPETDNAVGITTPAQRLDDMDKMVAAVAKKSAAEQEQIAAELAKQIQDESDPLIRRHIVRTLGYYKSPTSQAVLRAALNDADTDVRIACCDAWSRQGGSDAADALASLLTGDTNVDVRLASARALGQLHDRTALSPLAEVLTDGNPAIQRRAAESLKQISGKDFGADPTRWRAYAKGEAAEEDKVSIAGRLKKIF